MIAAVTPTAIGNPLNTDLRNILNVVEPFWPACVYRHTSFLQQIVIFKVVYRQ